MDPNETLARIRRARARVVAALDGDDDIVEAATALNESAEHLDEWLSKGGFPPDDWKPWAPLKPENQIT